MSHAPTDALRRRHHLVREATAAERLDAAAVMETALGPLATSATRQAVARAESKPQALTFVLMAPEFQRR